MNSLGYSERLGCSIVGLSRSTYYEIKHHRPSDREIRHLLLDDAVAHIYERSRHTYGVRRIRAALEIEQGLIVNYKLVLKIMRRLGLKGIPGPKKGRKNLVNAATAEDLVKRQFSATRPNELWLTDITEHPTREAKVYCCCVLDLFSRRVVGFSINRHCDSDLVNGALSMAARSRDTTTETVIHSDHGSQFTSWAFSQNIARIGLSGSMGTVGDCYDNAPMESFWGSMQTELLDRKKWSSVLELSEAMADYIEHFYYPVRRHSSLDYLTPDEFEAANTSTETVLS
ncbi:MAG: IS3 family transposase [Acidimicrobiales bacterium]